MTQAFFNWSSGKDSALALHAVRRRGDLDIASLLTTVSTTHRRVSQHGVRVELLERQAAALGLPLDLVWLPDFPGMVEYEAQMAEAVARQRAAGRTHAVFGDIFLEDLRVYREQKLATAGIEAVFPIWKRDTRELLEEFIAEGFRAVVVCVNEAKLDRSFAGRELDAAFLADLPADVDPCGENGEYHTFCYAGPIFTAPLCFRSGEVVHRTYTPRPQDDNLCPGAARQRVEETHFWFCDLIPEET
jgi:uncharacterized protein (TIGR00290 family)